MAETRSAVKPKSFNDKDKPTEVRLSNIVAAKGMFWLGPRHIVSILDPQIRNDLAQTIPSGTYNLT